MDPLVGKTLAHFRVEERIGSGGMGIVYRASDTELGREVAIKILPEAFAKDPARISRFRREAKLLAALNHPGIATIHGLEKPRRGPRFLVLELIAGESLADRLKRGPLPIEEALRVCGEIASALEAAHEHGIIHRDIKPANVMLAARGVVKLLDFGLAHHKSPSPEPDGSTSSLSTPTEPGKVLGTPGYMSPEQARAEGPDSRVDVFGFGCVLFECVTGTRAFPGLTVSDRLLAALSGEPDWGQLPVGTPQQLRRLIADCLERDAQRRLASMSRARKEIEELTRSGREIPSSAEGPAAPPHNLPEQLTSFVGRGVEIRACLDALRRSRLVTLTGTGGCGKTRLALKVAQTLRGMFPDGTWLVDLAPVSDASRVASTLASTLGIREEPSAAMLSTIVRRLAAKRLLLILDNCEHMLAPCSEAARRLLEGCGEVVILATSRESMHLAGEQAYPVPTMAIPAPELGPEEIGGVESVRLFVERARALAPQFQLSKQTAPAVAEICRRLDGIPLALELAAARIQLLSPEEILGLLGDRFRLLVGGGGSRLPRHQTLAATIEWSYSQLDEWECSLFRSLSVFTGGWGVEAGSAVCGDRGADRLEYVDGMTRLVDKSLALVEQSSEGESRCRYLETVRQFALDKLRQRGEEEAARDRHLAYFLDLAERAAPELTGPSQGRWLSRLESDHENLLAALAWGSRRPEGDIRALRLGAALWRFWLAHGYFVTGRRILEDLLGRPVARPPSQMRVEALLGAGALAFHQNHWDPGHRYFEESLTISRAIGYREGVGHALIGLGNLSLGQEDFPPARARYREAMEKFDEAGYRRGAGLALSNLGRVAELEGNLAEAWDLYQQGIDIFREVGDGVSLALRLSSMGDLSLRLGRRDAACEQLGESLRLIQSLEERRAGAYALARSATLAMDEKRLREAAVLYGASDAVRRRIGPAMTPWEESEYDSRVARARLEFGEDRFAAAWAEGAALSFGNAIGYALGCLDSITSDLPGRTLRPPSG